MRKTPFRLAVINDEVSEDFDHACHVIAVDFGLQWIELRGMWGKNILDLDAKEVAESRRILEKYKLRVTDIASPLFKTDWPGAPISPNSPHHDQFGAAFTFKQQDQVLERCIELTKAFSTERVRCFDFWRLEDPAPYRKDMNEKLREAAGICAKHNVILMLENEMACNTATGPEAARVLASIPDKNFMLNWDAANAAAAGGTPFPNGYEQLPKHRIAHCHCKDVIRHPDGKFEWEPVGGGMVNWLGQIKALLGQHYQHGFSLETHWRGAGTAEASTRVSFAGMLKVLKEAGAVS
jgi:L-ribulose-5-phosphate 3-epimerase